MSASSAWQFKRESGLKRKYNVENKFPSKIERRKWYDDDINYGFSLSRREESSHEPFAQCLFCFAIWNIAIGDWLLQNCRVIYKTNTAFSRTSSAFFKQQYEYLCKKQNSLQSSVVNDSPSKPSLLSSFQIGHVLIKQKKLFAKLSLSSKHAWRWQQLCCMVESMLWIKVEQIPLPNNEHSIISMYCESMIILMHYPCIYNRRMGMQ